jgi:hypothetical protein
MFSTSCQRFSVEIKQMAMNAHSPLRCLPFLVLASLVLAPAASPKPSRHTIRFVFSYDFRITPPCSSTVKEKCVQQFNFYEISPGISNRVKLGSIPAPADATGFIKGITGTTKPFLFTSGRHMVAVSAQMPDGSESDLSQCTKIIKIP